MPPPNACTACGRPSSEATSGAASSPCSCTSRSGRHSRATGSRAVSIGAARAAPKSSGNTTVGMSRGGIPTADCRAAARNGAASASVRPACDCLDAGGLHQLAGVRAGRPEDLVASLLKSTGQREHGSTCP